jgi:hypothetical protein
MTNFIYNLILLIEIIHEMVNILHIRHFLVLTGPLNLGVRVLIAHLLLVGLHESLVLLQELLNEVLLFVFLLLLIFFVEILRSPVDLRLERLLHFCVLDECLVDALILILLQFILAEAVGLYRSHVGGFRFDVTLGEVVVRFGHLQGDGRWGGGVSVGFPVILEVR